jgi:hypothetical protein
MSKRNLIAIGVLFVVLLGAIFVTLLSLSSNQDNRSSANTPDDLYPVVTNAPIVVDTQDAGTGDPGIVEAVSVNYPNQEGDSLDYTKASCTWDPNPNASQYSLKITHVDTNTVLKEELVANGINKDVFNVLGDNTYRCEVAAINASGIPGAAGSDEQVCPAEVTAQPSPTTPVVTTVPSPILTASPTATLIPTQPPVTTVIPTLPPAGNIGTIAAIGLGGVILFLIGGALLFL